MMKDNFEPKETKQKENSNETKNRIILCTNKHFMSMQKKNYKMNKHWTNS